MSEVRSAENGEEKEKIIKYKEVRNRNFAGISGNDRRHLLGFSEIWRNILKIYEILMNFDAL